MPRLRDFKPKEKTSTFKVIHYSPWDALPDNDEHQENEPTRVNFKKEILETTTERGPIGVQKGFEKGSKEVQKRFKRGLKEVQNEFKTGSIEGQKGVQKGSELGSKEGQNGFEKGSETGSERGSKEVLYDLKITPTFSAHNVGLSISEEQEIINTITGAQKEVLFNIVDICCSKGTLITPPLQRKTLSIKLGLPFQTVKTVLRRLLQKKIIKTQRNKRGIGGFCCFEITESVKNYVLENKKFNELEKGSKKGLEMGSASHVVCSSNNINTTTTEEIKNNLPPDWLDIDYSELKEYGFDENRLIQIHRELRNKEDLYLSPQIIQDSINHLAFDLKNNDIAKNFTHPPVAVLTSMLKKGKPYSTITPNLYKTPQEAALLKYQENNRLIEARRKELEEDLKTSELSIWLENMSGDELLNQFYDQERLQQIGDDKLKRTLALRAAKANAEEYFSIEIWPSKKKEILQNAEKKVN